MSNITTKSFVRGVGTNARNVGMSVWQKAMNTDINRNGVSSWGEKIYGGLSAAGQLTSPVGVAKTVWQNRQALDGSAFLASQPAYDSAGNLNYLAHGSLPRVNVGTTVNDLANNISAFNSPLSYSNQGNFANTPIPKGNVTTVADFTNTMPRIAGGLDSMHSAPSGYGMVVPKTGQTTVQDLSNNIGALPALSSGSPLDQALAKKSAPRSTGPSPLARANATAIARAGHSSGWRSGIGGEGIGSGWSTVAPENWGTLFEILGQQTGSNDRSMVRNAQQEY